MKRNCSPIGRNQADVHATTMAILEKVVGIKYTSSVALSVRDLKEKPGML